MAALATLSIDLEARLGRMEESLARAERETAKSSARIAKSLGSIGDVGARLGTVFAGLAGALSVGAIVNQVRAVVDGFDAFNDAADATGATIEKLSALEEVGNRTGTSFDTVTGILVKFNKMLDEAGDGNSGAAKALAAIGLQAEELRRLDPAEALQRTARALQGYADDGNKARLVQELFGKSVREAAPFLKDLAEQGELNGRVTREQADAADRFNKSIFALTAQMTTFKRTLLEGVIPALAEFFEAVNKKGLGAAFYDNFDRRLASNFAAAQSKRAAEITAELERLESVPRSQRGIYNQDRIARLRGELDAVLKASTEANERVKALINGPDFQAPKPLTTQQLLRGNAGYGELPSVAVPERGTTPAQRAERDPRLPNPERLRLTTRPLDASVGKTIADAEKLFGTWDRQAEAAERFGASIKLQTADLSASLISDARARGEAQLAIDRQTLQAQLDALQVYGDERARLQDAIDANMAARQAALTESLKPEWQRLVEGWADTTAHMAKSWDDLMAGVVNYAEDALEKFIRTGKLSVDDLAAYVQQAIARMLAQKAVAELANLASFLFGGFSPAATGKAFSAGGGEVNAFAAGGVVSRPTYFRYGSGGTRNGLMGEAGPEAILPLKRGANGRLGVQSSAQAGPTVNVYLPMGVTRAELAAFVPTLKAQISSELVSRMRRPGFAGG